MKTPLLLALAGLAISFALPSFAQEQNAVDPEVGQQIEDSYNQRVDVYNKHDAAAYAALFTQDVVRVNATGLGDALSSGQEAIKKTAEVDMASGSVVNGGRILQVYAVGSELCAISEFSIQHRYTPGRTLLANALVTHRTHDPNTIFARQAENDVVCLMVAGCSRSAFMALSVGAYLKAGSERIGHP